MLVQNATRLLLANILTGIRILESTLYDVINAARISIIDS
jgi:hypothetical protein